jgi:hypothetical protein
VSSKLAARTYPRDDENAVRAVSLRWRVLCRPFDKAE